MKNTFVEANFCLKALIASNDYIIMQDRQMKCKKFKSDFRKKRLHVPSCLYFENHNIYDNLANNRTLK